MDIKEILDKNDEVMNAYFKALEDSFQARLSYDKASFDLKEAKAKALNAAASSPEGLKSLGSNQELRDNKLEEMFADLVETLNQKKSELELANHKLTLCSVRKDQFRYALRAHELLSHLP